ncbi:36488_t:CDS:2, partial [Gigaspora margarita]
MDPLVQVVTLELNNTQPTDITIDPIPYSPYNPFQEKVKKTHQKLIQLAHYRSRQKKLLIYTYYLDELLQEENNLLIIGKYYLEEISSSRNSFNIP